MKDRTWILALWPAAAVVLFYLPVLNNGFVTWDDPDRIVRNPGIRALNWDSLKWMFTTLSGSYWMPLTWLSYTFDHRLGGLDPRVYHLHSLLLHALNTALVFALTWRLLGRARDASGVEASAPFTRVFRIHAALLAAILFGLHPLRVESVAWASERKDVLYAFFFLASLFLYLGRGAAPFWKGWRGFACLGCFILSLMSKPMAVSLPAVLLILDAWPLGRLRDGIGRPLAEKLPFLIPAAAVAWVTMGAPAHALSPVMAPDLSLFPRVVNAFRSLAFYMLKTVAPTDLVPLVPFPRVMDTVYHLENLAAVVTVLAVAAVVFHFRSRAPYLAAAGVYYVVTLLPVLGLVQAGSQAAADRFSYLPSLGLILPLSVGVAVLFKDRRKPWMLFAVVTVVLLGSLTVRQIGIWKDSITLWERTASVYPSGSHFIHSNLAVSYAEKGRLEDALREYEKAASIPPRWAQVAAVAGRAAVLADLGKEEEAIRELRRVLEMDPRNVLAHQNLWVLYGRQGKYPEALEEMKAAIGIEPGNAEHHNKTGFIHVRMGQVDEAVECFRTCVRLAPMDAGYHINLGNLLMQKGLFLEAVEAYHGAARLLPRDRDTLLRLAKACEKAGLDRQAEEYYSRAEFLPLPGAPGSR